MEEKELTFVRLKSWNRCIMDFRHCIFDIWNWFWWLESIDKIDIWHICMKIGRMVDYDSWIFLDITLDIGMD
jgi:hypothetical protein